MLQAGGCTGSETCSLPWGGNLLLVYGGHHCFPVPFGLMHRPFAGQQSPPGQCAPCQLPVQLTCALNEGNNPSASVLLSKDN